MASRSTPGETKEHYGMDDMKNCLGDVFFCSITYLLNYYKKAKKMMFPIRNDVSVECETEKCKVNSCFCKIIRSIACILVVIFLLLFINALYAEPPPPEEKVESQPSTCTIELGEKMKEEIKAWIQKEIQINSKICSKNSAMSPEQMRNIVKEEIKRQQKTQLKPDFASASAGGMVLAASPTWTEGYSYIYFLFIPIRSTAPSPSIVLEATRQAGDCWPMQGQRGSLLIQLAARANIVGFTMEHIDSAMSLSGGTPEAPNNFSVYGIENPDNPRSRFLFGTYCYDNKHDDESQYFRVQNVHGFIDRAYHCR